MSDALEDTLTRAAIGGIEVPVVGVKSVGGQDHASHTANLVPAADHQITGRKAYEDTFRVPFLTTLSGWGDLYPVKFEAVIRLFEMQRSGQYLRLQHPFFGEFPVLVHQWVVEGAPNVRSGAWVDFAWKEQNDSASLALNALGEVPDDAGNRAVRDAQAADEALAAVGVTTTFGADVTAYFAAASEEGQLQPAAEVATIDAVERSARAALSLPALALSGATGFSAMHAAAVAVERLLASLDRWRRATTPDPARSRVYVAPSDMTFAEVSLAVYGTLDRVFFLRADNPLSDVLIQRGTRLTINPL